MRIVGELARRFSSLQRESPREGSALCVFSKLFHMGVFYVLDMRTSADASLLSLFLQMDQHLRLSYNFSSEVEFRAIRSLTLGKVTGLFFLSMPFRQALLK